MILGTIYKGSTVRYSVERIKFVRPELALVFLRQFLQFFEGGAARDLQARPTMLVESADGKWRIVAMQNTRITETGTATQRPD